MCRERKPLRHLAQRHDLFVSHSFPPWSHPIFNHTLCQLPDRGSSKCISELFCMIGRLFLSRGSIVRWRKIPCTLTPNDTKLGSLRSRATSRFILDVAQGLPMLLPHGVVHIVRTQSYEYVRVLNNSTQYKIPSSVLNNNQSFHFESRRRGCSL